MKELKQNEWNQSYLSGDNTVFYPSEEVIRFYSKHIRKKTGLTQFEDRFESGCLPKVLDLGCGIGRHLIFAHQMGFDPYGVDLSVEALKTARAWLNQLGVSFNDSQVVEASITELPWPDRYFDFAVSHGVLDSMYFEIAQAGVQELARTMKAGGLFYCDLISGDDSAHAREFFGDEVVESAHEQGTVQSYYNFQRIKDLIGDSFSIEEAYLIKKEDVLKGVTLGRWHLVFKRNL